MVDRAKRRSNRAARKRAREQQTAVFVAQVFDPTRPDLRRKPRANTPAGMAPRAAAGLRRELERQRSRHREDIGALRQMHAQEIALIRETMKPVLERIMHVRVGEKFKVLDPPPMRPWQIDDQRRVPDVTIPMREVSGLFDYVIAIELPIDAVRFAIMGAARSVQSSDQTLAVFVREFAYRLVQRVEHDVVAYVMTGKVPKDLEEVER